jgi:disulfide bond formation protein DsbB
VDLTIAAIAMFVGAVALAMLGIIGNKNLSDMVRVALILAITILSYGFLHRYQQVKISDGSVVSVVDGLTGQVTFCYSSGCRTLK